MKIEDMVMVIYNQKGIEKNFLCSFEHFIKKYATDACDSYFEMAEVAAGLQETKQKDSSFLRCIMHPIRPYMLSFVVVLMNSDYLLQGNLTME